MFEQTFKDIDDILHKDAGCTSELDYTEQSSWLLFLKSLDAVEHDKASEAELEGRAHAFILAEPYRWEAWAAPAAPTLSIGRKGDSAGVGGSRNRRTALAQALPKTAASETDMDTMDFHDGDAPAGPPPGR